MRWFDAAQETVWHAIVRSDPDSLRRRYDLRDLLDSFLFHARVWWVGFAMTVLAVSTSVCLQGPQVVVATHLALEASGGATAVMNPNSATIAGLLDNAINALGTQAARLAVIRAAGWGLLFPDLSPDRSGDAATALHRLDEQHLVQRDEGGLGLVVSAWHQDAKAALALNRALVAFVLTAQPTAGSLSAGVEEANAASRQALLAVRARLGSELETADRRAAGLSQSLTDLARDMVAALRATDNRSTSTEVSDQGAALLAELQLKRLQMASKYQDGYPALVALDGEIAKLRGVVAGEQKRSSVVRSAANPVFATLESERRRVEAELDGVNGKRSTLHSQIEGTDHRLASIAPPPGVPRLAAGAPVSSLGADPPLISVPLMVLVGLSGTLLLQWLLLRERQQLVTPAEVELTLGLPVLRCLDAKGISLRSLEGPALRLGGADVSP